MSEYPSGNALRDAGLLTVIKEAQEAGEPITPASITLNCQRRFNPSFVEVTATELAEALAYMTPPADAEAEAETADAEAEAVPERKPPSMSYQEAEQMAKDAASNLLSARRELIDAVTAQKAARGVLSVAVMNWQNGGIPRPLTRDELIRQHIASEQIRKAEAVNARGSVAPSHGPTAYDLGRAGHGGSVNRRYAPTRRGLVAGQKAYSLNESIARSGSGVVDLKGRAAVKLPSER